MGLLSFGKSQADYVAVDLSGSQVRMLCAVSKNGKLVFQDPISKKVPQAGEAEIFQEVVAYFKKNKVKAKEVVCAIPSKLFISKNVEIPSTEKDEIAKIIDLQAGRFTPYSRDEIVIDFVCMETPAQHYTSVLLVIVNRSLIDRYCRFFEDIGIPVKIIVSSEPMTLVCQAGAGAVDSGVVMAGLCVGDDATDFTVVDRNQLIFVRSFPVGIQHFQTKKDAATQELLNELNKSLAAYQDQGVGKAIKKLVLTGLPDAMWLLAEIVRGCPILQRFETIAHFYDSAQLLTAEGHQLPPALMGQAAGSFFDLMAALSRSDKAQINLIPKEVKIKRKFRESSRDLTSLGITVMTIFIVLSLFLYSKIYFKTAKMEKLVQAGKPAFEEARGLERISTKNRVARKILKTRGKGLAAFEQVAGLLGDTTYLAHFDYSIEGKLSLRGTSDSMSQVFALVNRLESSNYYASVKATETKSRREGTRDVADFEIECLLLDGALAEKAEAAESE